VPIRSPERVALFLCECGPILKETLDLDAIGASLQAQPEVARVLRHATLCSEEGRAWMLERLREGPGERVVVAACSPREHEQTFRRVCSEAGINPFLLAIANIREQCAWVTPERGAATRKAVLLAHAAVARALRQAPLAGRDIEAHTDVVVVGAGVAGLTAARSLAAADRNVVLVERSPAIGGRTAQLAELYPAFECASCMIEPLMDEVLHHPRIKLRTLAEVEEVLGYFGNFTVRIRQRARHVDVAGCYGCKSCQAVCPVEAPDAVEGGLASRKAVHIAYTGCLPNASLIDEATCRHFVDGSCEACVAACPFGNIDLGQREELVEVQAGAVVLATGADLDVSREPESAFALPQVYTTMELERMLNASGFTGGAVRLRDGRAPSSVALVHCADSRGRGPVERCSKTCCMSMLKYARLLRHKLPEASLLMVCWERCLAGKGYREMGLDVLRKDGIEIIQLGLGDRLEIVGTNGAPVSLRTHLSPGGEAVDAAGGLGLQLLRRDRAAIETAVDMVVMAPPLSARATTQELARRLRIDLDDAGFVREEHPRLRSFSTRVEGILVAGTAQGPRDVEEAVSHGAAAAGAALSALVPGRKLHIDPARAQVASERCGGCRTCLRVCPYKAIAFDAAAHAAVINELLCRGCGACAASCPASAIEARHFTDAQIEAEVEALLR
jgi:heterodisulfide reductase subunit A2